LDHIAGLSRKTSGLSEAVMGTIGLAAMVVLFSTIAPATKYVFETSHVDPNLLSCARVGIGFLCLLPTALMTDARGLASLTWPSIVRLTGLGWLGVVSYAAAAWSLQYTSVSHYILIYSLIPTFTALFGIVLGKQVGTLMTFFGVGCASLGCLIAISDTSVFSSFSLGDGYALLYTVMMAGHMAWSGGVAKKFGVLTANTVMFGTSFLVLLPVSLAGTESGRTMSYTSLALIAYIGLATVGAFVLRYWTLRRLPPTMVAAYHNLIPVCTILLANMALGEPIGMPVIVGGATILLGIELVRKGDRLFTICQQRLAGFCAIILPR
jgi:drug/metabolite transporter (DMT)-like permease